VVVLGGKGCPYIPVGLGRCDVSGTVIGGECVHFMCSLCVVHKTCSAVVMCLVTLLLGIVCTLCVPCVLCTKYVQPDDGLLITLKHGSPLHTYIFSCVYCYYIIITLKQPSTIQFCLKSGKNIRKVVNTWSTVMIICPWIVCGMVEFSDQAVKNANTNFIPSTFITQIMSLTR